MTKPKANRSDSDSILKVELRAAELSRATGTENEHLQLQRLRAVLNTVWLPGPQDHDEQNSVIAAVLAALKKIAPLDELEGMLAAQMVATHNTAMECLRRAMLAEQTFEGRQENLKYAAKFLGLYTRQIEAFDKHRGKGQQKITVEHVQVHAGGQAIVGHVDAKGRKTTGADTDDAKRLANNPDPAVPPVKPPSNDGRRAPVKARS